jgi:hypothetical protein
VVVLAGIGASDHHDDELRVLEHLLVAYRRTQHVPVLVYPLLEIEWAEGFHILFLLLSMGRVIPVAS